MQFSKGMLHDLKSVSRLSSRKNWEYAGKFEMGVNGRYKGITRHTSEKENQVDVGAPRRFPDVPHAPVYARRVPRVSPE